MNKSKLLILSILLTFCFSCDLAESDFGKEKTFIKFYGDNTSNIGVKALPTADGGYILGGYSIIGDSVTYPDIIKTNLYGNVEWQEIISPDTNTTRLEDMIITQSGEYALLSTVFKDIGNGLTRSDFRLTLLDITGQITWSKDYDVNGTSLINDEASGIIQTSDGGFAIIGTTQTGVFNSDMFVVRTDSDGNAIWDKVYGNTGNLNDEGISIAELPNGNFFWFGTEQTSIIRTQIRLVQTNALGNLLSDFNYMVTDAGGQNISSNNTTAGDMFLSTSGGSSGVFMTGSIGGNLVVIRADLSGNLVWSLPISPDVGNNTGNTILLSSGNELMVAGETLSSNQSGDISLLRVSTTGNLVESNSFQATGKSTASAIIETPDNGFLIAGTVNLDNTNQMMVLIKTNLLGKVSE